MAINRRKNQTVCDFMNVQISENVFLMRLRRQNLNGDILSFDLTFMFEAASFTFSGYDEGHYYPYFIIQDGFIAPRRRSPPPHEILPSSAYVALK